MKVTKRRIIEEKLNFLKEKEQLGLLTEQDKADREQLSKKLVQSKRGSGSRRKGANFERKLAKIFKDRFNIELVRTPLSGGFAKKSNKADGFRGDITTVDKSIEFKLHIEAKDQKTWKLKDWLNQAKSDCPKGSIPIVVFHKSQEIKENKVVEKSTNYVALELEDFLSLVHKEDIIRKRVNE